MLTETELNLLVELISRAGMNKYEVVWINNLLARMKAEINANKPEVNKLDNIAAKDEG